jgi:hypothetical protein
VLEHHEAKRKAFQAEYIRLSRRSRPTGFYRAYEHNPTL